MESACLGEPLPSGWMNRLLQVWPDAVSATTGISFTAGLPHIFFGKAVTTNFPIGGAVRAAAPLDHPRVKSLFAPLHDSQDPLGRAYRDGLHARERLLADLAHCVRSSDVPRARMAITAPTMGTAMCTACWGGGVRGGRVYGQ